LREWGKFLVHSRAKIGIFPPQESPTVKDTLRFENWDVFTDRDTRDTAGVSAAIRWPCYSAPMRCRKEKMRGS